MSVSRQCHKSLCSGSDSSVTSSSLHHSQRPTRNGIPELFQEGTMSVRSPSLEQSVKVSFHEKKCVWRDVHSTDLDITGFATPSSAHPARQWLVSIIALCSPVKWISGPSVSLNEVADLVLLVSVDLEWVRCSVCRNSVAFFPFPTATHVTRTPTVYNAKLGDSLPLPSDVIGNVLEGTCLTCSATDSVSKT